MIARRRSRNELVSRLSACECSLASSCHKRAQTQKRTRSRFCAFHAFFWLIPGMDVAQANAVEPCFFAHRTRLNPVILTWQHDCQITPRFRFGQNQMNIDVELDRVNTPAVPATVLAPVFALALFTSPALLFWVQPLVAKMLLPLLGGAPAGWNTCMVFFQSLLLAGYAYALFVSQRLSLKNQAIVHAVLLLAAGLVLPFGLSERVLSSLPTQSSPILWLF